MLRAMTRALILGGGMVGSAMAMDLANDDGFDVTVADLRAETLETLKASYGVTTQRIDLSDAAAVTKLASGYDVVLGALSSTIGLQALGAVIEAGRPYCDISFMAEDATQLSERARAKGVTAVVDCGVAPGMSNLLCGHATTVLDPCERIEIYVGGLPVERRWPYQYKAGFAPADVLEEYTRPARMVEGGKEVVRPPLGGIELLDFAGIGTLEAFETDGLRTLIHTLNVPTMVEKTMRYPGHADLMRVLRESGMFSKTPIEVNGRQVVPLEVTSALLFPQWTYEEGEADLTVMRIVAEGKKNGTPTRLSWDLLDYYDPKTKLRSMSRTTGFPCTIVARALADGTVREPGVHPPEHLGKDPALVERILSQLADRDIHFRAAETKL